MKFINSISLYQMLNKFKKILTEVLRLFYILYNIYRAQEMSTLGLTYNNFL